MIILIASMGNNNEIGKENKSICNLNYHKHKLQKETKGNVVVMGRSTFDNLIINLEDTKKIVLSKKKQFKKEVGNDVQVVDNVLDLIKKCKSLSEKKDVYIVGGESIFNLFVNYADKMYITKIDKTVEDADAFFPKIETNEWNEKVLDNNKEKNIEFSFIEYTKK